ncbi:MAG TPA: flagellar export protein FliJ [Deltaproteobacteria bacterium]|nr:flagellar export protein FliJ [Deltaproteobacteria bacterium]
MAFRFKFETLLDVRKMQENMAQQAFSQSQRQLRALIAMKERVLARKDVLRAELVTRMKSGLGSSEVKRYYDYLLHLDEGVARIDENIVKAEHQAEEKRQELLRAERAHKAMRRLREIHQDRHEVAERRAEMHFLDEIAVMRAGGER